MIDDKFLYGYIPPLYDASAFMAARRRGMKRRALLTSRDSLPVGWKRGFKEAKHRTLKTAGGKRRAGHLPAQTQPPRKKTSVHGNKKKERGTREEEEDDDGA